MPDMTKPEFVIWVIRYSWSAEHSPLTAFHRNLGSQVTFFEMHKNMVGCYILDTNVVAQPNQGRSWEAGYKQATNKMTPNIMDLKGHLKIYQSF